jgi:hypothetical protein
MKSPLPFLPARRLAAIAVTSGSRGAPPVNPLAWPFLITAPIAGALILTTLLLGACDRSATSPMATAPTASQAMPAATASAAEEAAATAAISSTASAASGTDPSVPPAASVLEPAPAAKADAAQGRTNKAMSRTQESTAMPMPGQNNDHSAPLPPARRASAP